EAPGPTLIHDRTVFVATPVCPSAGESPDGADVGQPVEVDADAELFVEFVSGVVDETLAVLVIVVVGPDCTVYVACTLSVCPTFMLPRVHGNDEHAPVAETNVNREGVGSLS